MDDQLDKDIKNRIGEVFDNYDDPSADEGWALLREKFPATTAKRRAVAWLWWSVAAMLLLFLSVGLWEFEKTATSEKITVIKKHSPALHQNVIAQKSAPVVPNNAQTAIVKSENENKSTQEGIAKNDAKNLKQAHNNPFIAGNAPKITPAITDTSSKIAHTVKRKDSIIHNIVQPPANQFAAAGKTNTSNPAANPGNPGTIKPAGDNPKKNSPAVPKTATPAKSIASMFAGDNQPVNKKIDVEKRVHFGVYAATYFNYAKGSGNQANLGAGVTSEITLTKNLKLVTGITIAQNSLVFNSSTPVDGSQNPSFSAASTGIAAGSAPSPNLSQMAVFSTGVVNTASVPAYKDYNASLVGLDIPVNLKYEFNPGKNDFYVLAGFSSGTFVNETYTYQYNYPALVSPGLQQVRNATSRNSFNSFYVGKMLNFAFGVGYPVGKNRIILEPFLKYPLEGLGSQDIKFGAGGINLKFNFTTKR